MTQTASLTPVKGLSDDEFALIRHLSAQLEQKTARNHLRACYYDGKRALAHNGGLIPPQYYKLKLVLGWSAKAVDLLARRCNWDQFVWTDGDLAALGAQEVIDNNMLRSEISAALVSSLIHGPAFLINTEGAAGEPKSLIHVKDARNATGDWNARRRGLDNLLSITGRDGEGQVTAFALYLDGQTVTGERDLSGWQIDRTFHNLGVPAEALVYKPRPGRPFGSSRISRVVMKLHDAALRTVIRMEAHNDIYTIPDLWMFGADESIFKNADGTQKASWQVVMGRIKAVPDDEEAEGNLARADVKQFPAASPEPHIMSFKQQAQQFSGETSIPLTSLGVSDMSNPTSSDSYLASREDLVSEAEGAMDDWATPLRRSFARALAIQNGLSAIPAEFRSIDAKWRSPIHLSRAAAADAGAKQLAAVPWLANTEVGLELLGLDPQQIRRALAEKRTQQGRAALADLLAKRATTPPTGDEPPAG